MNTIFYRILACLGLVIGLSACNRATYSFTSQPAYSVEPVVALTTVADSPAAPLAQAAAPTPGTPIDVAGPAHHTRRRAHKAYNQPVEQLAKPAATAHFGAALPRLRGRQAARRHQNTAASGALVPDSAVSGLGQLLVILAVLVCLAVGALALFVTKATVNVVEGKYRKSNSSTAPRPTP